MYVADSLFRSTNNRPIVRVGVGAVWFCVVEVTATLVGVYRVKLSKCHYDECDSVKGTVLCLVDSA